MKKLINLYSLDLDYEIVSYCTNLYTLYNELFLDNDPSSFDLLQLLKERESIQERKKIFDYRYSDILLIFDMDPQANDFDAKKIKRFQSRV